MPFKSEKLKMKKSDDRRRKLTDAQRSEIAVNAGGLSQRELARMYGVSRRTVQFILDPAKAEQNKLRREERGGSKIYYVKEKHTIATREHRQYKQQLYLKGLLIDETDKR